MNSKTSKGVKMFTSKIQLLSADKILESSFLDEKRRATRIEINQPVRYRKLEEKSKKLERASIIPINPFHTILIRNK